MCNNSAMSCNILPMVNLGPHQSLFTSPYTFRSFLQAGKITRQGSSAPAGPAVYLQQSNFPYLQQQQQQQALLNSLALQTAIQNGAGASIPTLRRSWTMQPSHHHGVHPLAGGPLPHPFVVSTYNYNTLSRFSIQE